MKIRILLFVAVLGFTVTSCQKFKDLTAVQKDVEFKVDIPLETTDTVATSVNLKSVEATYPFSGSAEIDLETDQDVKDYVNGLQSITAGDVIANFSGIGTDQVINSLIIHAEVVGTSDQATFLGSNITSSNADGWIMTAFKNFINSWNVQKNHKVKFSVSGEANFKMKNNGSVQAKITIPSTVKYSPL